jgi:hypothetical protein
MKLLTVKDLGERWGLSESKVKKLVREKSIPFLGLGGGDMKVNWGHARFRPEAIESWEESHQQVCPTIPTTTQPLVMPTRSLLGDWRSKIKKPAGDAAESLHPVSPGRCR